KWSSGTAGITQNKLDTAILRFIVENVQPLAVVESPAFIDLIKIGLPSSIRIMCKKTLRDKLNKLYLDMKIALEKQFTEIDTVSTTADLWSKAKRSYLGVTVHWINPENLTRESAALACRRIKGKHTFDVLAKAINSIFVEYHIQNKICCTTTDNGSNFVKAFRDFEKEEDKEINTEFLETLKKKKIRKLTRNFVIYDNLSDLLITNEESLDTEDITLPPHHRCVSHTLNLIAAKDSERALENDPTYKKKYRIIFAKLSKLWNKQNQSTQVADKIKDICGVYLKTPVITRWNSTFDSTYQLVTLLKDSSDKINHCLDYCNLQRLTNNDVKFLDEYCQVMEPLARALDILQSDVGMYMGYLLPVLSSLQEKLKNIKNLTDCQSLVIAIQEGLNRRFCTIFEKKELIIASSLHPKFKLNWLNGDKKKLARAYLEDLLDIRSNESSSNSSKDNDYDDFFNFHGQSTSTSESGEEELTRFLKSKRSDVALLLDFPKLKKLFIKFNTALPSSASVERLFSIGNSVLS
ncbi:Putative AC9 transposase, partial [Camponotus floridanus]